MVDISLIYSVVITILLAVLFFRMRSRNAHGKKDNMVLHVFEKGLLSGVCASQFSFFLIAKCTEDTRSVENSNIVYYHPSCTSFFEYEKGASETINRLLERIGLDVLQRNLLLSAFKAGQKRYSDVQIRDSDGNMQTLRLELHSIPSPKGYMVLKARKTRTSGGDSTGVSETGWEEYISTAPVAVCILQADGHIKEHNVMLASLLPPHMQQGTFVGDNFFSLLMQESNNSLQKTLMMDDAQAIMRRNPIRVAFDTGGEAGEMEYGAAIYLRPMTENGGTQTQLFIAYMVDMRHQQAVELRHTQAQKMQAVGQLAGGVAHDFNNLLTAMIGFCDLLLMRHTPSDESFSDVMQIKQNANRAASLVRQLLAFSRKQTLQPEVIDITETLADLSNLLTRLMGERIDLNIYHGRDIYPVLVDQGQLEQVIINLAVNARDAMQDKGGILTIRTDTAHIEAEGAAPQGFVSAQSDKKMGAGDYLLIDIIDSGCGMNEEVIGQIFDPFFTTKGVGEGTGLGLSTVYGIIQQTGGHIFVKSKEGKGTTFRIYLKRHIQEEGAQQQENTQMRGADSAPKDLTGQETILLVEDEAAVRLFSSRALQNKGYRVLEAASGEAALDVVAQHGDEIDMIISDVMMPGMTGPDMVREVTATRPDIKVIFISGYGEDAFYSTYGKERAFNFLAKPYSLKQLAGKVKEVMERANP